MSSSVNDKTAAVLRLEQLSVSFPARDQRRERGKRLRRVRAVDQVSLSVAAGETLAVVGESGSGKSVTALSIMGLVPEPGRVDEGKILFDGVDLTGLTERGIRGIRGNKIAMVFQEPMTSLNPSLTIGMQVAEPLSTHRGGSWRDALPEAQKLLKKVAIPDAESRLAAYPHQFSGGMRQRVMIAMALACKPKLIIADEPTTALDVTIQAQILALLKELTAESGAALILITHDLGVVARYADRVAVMYAGRLVETARAPDLYSHPRHPYTQGLLRSLPRIGSQGSGKGEDRERLVPIAGQPPDLSQLPEGCSFSPRCPQAHSRCLKEQPALEDAAPDHAIACFGPESAP